MTTIDRKKWRHNFVMFYDQGGTWGYENMPKMSKIAKICENRENSEK
jgi:hypothetical protein